MSNSRLKNLVVAKVLSEEKTPGIEVTRQVHKEDGKENKEYYREVKKKMADYDKALAQKGKENITPPEFNYTGTKEEDYHKEIEIMNGQEMIEYDREPSEQFKDRAIKAIEGHPTMGNGPGANAEATWGASSDTFGKDLVKSIKKSKETRDSTIIPKTWFGDDIELVDQSSNKTVGGSKKIAVESEDKITQKRKTMKRLRFKQPFGSSTNALRLIPEDYKVNNKVFEMTDGKQHYRVRWEGTLTEGHGVLLAASDKSLVKEDIDKMKHLMNYRSENTLGTLKGKARVDESNNFRAMLDKTKALLTENVDESDEINEIEDNNGKSPEAKPGQEKIGAVKESEVDVNEMEEVPASSPESLPAKEKTGSVKEGEEVNEMEEVPTSSSETKPGKTSEEPPGYAHGEGPMVMAEDEVEEGCKDKMEETEEVTESKKTRFDQVFEGWAPLSTDQVIVKKR